MLRNIKEFIPRVKWSESSGKYVTDGQGYQIQKFHDTKWLAHFIGRFGSPWNYDAGRGESLLKRYAKQPGATAQKTSDEIMSRQLFDRLQEIEALSRYSRKRRVNFIVDTLKEKKRKRPTSPSAPQVQQEPDKEILTDSDSDDRSGCGPKDDEVPPPNAHIQLRASLWQMEVSITNDGAVSRQLNFLSQQEDEMALPAIVAKSVFAHACECIRDKEQHTAARVTGYAEIRLPSIVNGNLPAPATFIRSHPSYSCVTSVSSTSLWYDWILVNWSISESDVPPEDIPGDVLDLPRDNNHFLPPGVASEGNPFPVEYLAQHNWPATFLPSIFPAKVLAIYSVATGPDAGSLVDDDIYLVVHSGEEPSPGEQQRHSSLLLKRWRMEYHERSGAPLFRVVKASDVKGTVFVMDPYHDQPFIGRDQRQDPFIYGVFERSEVWPKQFLYSMRFADGR
jgi:hypothetical protein